MNYVKQDEFVSIALECELDPAAILTKLQTLYPTYTLSRAQIEHRLNSFRRKGLLPLNSGNSVSAGELLRSTSTLYDDLGNIKLQWVKSDVAKESFLEAFHSAISDMATSLPPLPHIPAPSTSLADLATLYISNDVHLGLLAWDKESGADYNLELAISQLRAAYDYLFDTSPSSKVGIVVDLGDLMEADNQKNVTPKSGNILSVDSRYPKVLRAAYEALIYAVEKALEKHELVYFYNIEGNHDLTSGHAIREVVRMAFRDNPRVIVNESPSPIKYHQHGTTLLGFAHGDGLKMRQSGEVMAHDCQDIFSSTTHRYFHLGHVHVDAVYDGKLCRAEPHRNLAPLNAWAHHAGYRAQPGTMKSITYSTTRGEVSRSLFTL